jgi:hypothetical protein
MLRRRVCASSSTPSHTCPLLHALDQRQEPVPLQWKSELCHHQPLHGERQRGIGCGLQTRKVEQRRSAHGERKPQGGWIGNRERSLHDGDERYLSTRADVCIGDAVKHSRLMPSGGECLREALEQRVLGSNQKNDRHAFTGPGRRSDDAQNDPL